MALLKLGQNASMIRGSIGGITYAANRAGAYARNRTNPINPRSTRQTAVRTTLSNVSQAWTALADTTRDEWAQVAGFATRTNRIGEVYTPTGRQLFMETNTALVNAGLPMVAGVPLDFTPPNIPAIDNVAFTEALGSLASFVITLTSATEADVVIVVDATPPFTGPKFNVQRFYRRVLVTADGVTAADIEAAWGALYGTGVVLGTQVGLRVRALNQGTGVFSPSQELIVAATV